MKYNSKIRDLEFPLSPCGNRIDGNRPIKTMDFVLSVLRCVPIRRAGGMAADAVRNLGRGGKTLSWCRPAALPSVRWRLARCPGGRSLAARCRALRLWLVPDRSARIAPDKIGCHRPMRFRASGCGSCSGRKVETSRMRPGGRVAERGLKVDFAPCGSLSTPRI